MVCFVLYTYLIGRVLNLALNFKKCVGFVFMEMHLLRRVRSWSPTFGGTKVNIDSDKSIMLSLLLPTWADNISDQNCVDAEMDPYLRAIDSFDFQELLSVKYSMSSGVIR